MFDISFCCFLGFEFTDICGQRVGVGTQANEATTHPNGETAYESDSSLG